MQDGLLSAPAPPGDRLAALATLGLGERLLTNPAALASFGSDALTAFHQRPLAVVVAETHKQARDAAEAVEVDYEPLDAVVGVANAHGAGALVHDEVETDR